MGKLLCKCCGHKISINRCRRTETGDFICDRCASNEYRRCSNCGNYIPLNHNRSICLDCDDIVYRKIINNYSTKPIPRFQSRYKGCKGVRYYGMELEIARITGETCYALFNELYKDKLIYNKSDGSIHGGTEIVTNPCDRANMIRLLDRLKEGLAVISEVDGYKDDAGIHFHVNKDSMSPITLYKLSYLFNFSMSEEEKRMIYHISGRNVYSTSKESEWSYCKLGKISNIKELKEPHEDRYLALNIRGKQTAEFRIFKTTCDVDIIKSYIDFIDYAIEFATTKGLKDMNISNFISWLKDNCSNAIINKKIKNFEKNNGIFHSKHNKYKVCVSELRGVNVHRYKNIIYDLERCNNITEVASIISHYKTSDSVLNSGKPRTRYGQDNQLKNRLEKTLKAVLISEIIKGVKQCA